MNTELKIDGVMSIAGFAELNGFTAVFPRIRVNVNKYPFVTFIKSVDGETVAENIYLSKRLSPNVKEGDSIKALAGNSVRLTENEAGEERVKIVSASEYVAVGDMFGKA